jgi:hypothetical protein
MGVPEEEVRLDEGQVAYGKGMVMDCEALLALEHAKVGVPEE